MPDEIEPAGYSLDQFKEELNDGVRVGSAAGLLFAGPMGGILSAFLLELWPTSRAQKLNKFKVELESRISDIESFKERIECEDLLHNLFASSIKNYDENTSSERAVYLSELLSGYTDGRIAEDGAQVVSSLLKDMSDIEIIELESVAWQTQYGNKALYPNSASVGGEARASEGNPLEEFSPYKHARQWKLERLNLVDGEPGFQAVRELGMILLGSVMFGEDCLSVKEYWAKHPLSADL